MREQIEAVILRWPRVVAGSAFGSPGYYVKGRVFAFWEGGGLVLRLPPQRRVEALALAGSRRYTTPRGSTPEWIFVASAEAAESELVALLRESYRFVGGEPAAC